MFVPLIKGLKVAPFVECPNCHILSPLSAKNCSGCSAEIKSEEDEIIYFLVLNTGARYRPFTPFVECPNCRKLLQVGVERCPDCYEEVTKEYALGSAAAVVVNTVACDIANTIRGFQAFAVLAVIGSVLIYLFDLYGAGAPGLFYFVLLWPVIPLTTSLLWLVRFGRFNGNEEYLSAKRGIERTLGLWLGILAAQIIALGVWWF